MNERLTERMKALHDRVTKMLDERFEKVTITREPCYVIGRHTYIRLCKLGHPFNGLVVEYAFEEEEAEKNWYYDGTIWGPAYYSDEEIIQNIMKEIEENKPKDKKDDVVSR